MIIAIAQYKKKNNTIPTISSQRGNEKHEKIHRGAIGNRISSLPNKSRVLTELDVRHLAVKRDRADNELTHLLTHTQGRTHALLSHTRALKARLTSTQPRGVTRRRLSRRDHQRDRERERAAHAITSMSAQHRTSAAKRHLRYFIYITDDARWSASLG